MLSPLHITSTYYEYIIHIHHATQLHNNIYTSIYNNFTSIHTPIFTTSIYTYIDIQHQSIQHNIYTSIYNIYSSIHRYTTSIHPNIYTSIYNINIQHLYIYTSKHLNIYTMSRQQYRRRREYEREELENRQSSPPRKRV